MVKGSFSLSHNLPQHGKQRRCSLGVEGMMLDTTGHDPELGPISRELALLSEENTQRLEYWLGRIEQTRLQQGAVDQPDWLPLFLDAHRETLFKLFDRAAALPATWPLALELAFQMLPVMRARRRFIQWLPVVQTLANAMTGKGGKEPLDDPLNLSKLWRAIALIYIELGDAERAGITYTIARDAAWDNRDEISAYIDWLLQGEQAAMRAWRGNPHHAERIAPHMIRAAREMRDLPTEAMAYAVWAFARLYQRDSHSAFAFAQQAFVIFHYLGDEREQLQTLHTMAEALRLDRTAQTRSLARRYLEQVRAGVYALGDEKRVVLVEQSLAALIMEMGAAAEAVDLLRRVRAFFAEAEVTDKKRRTVTATQSLGVGLYYAGIQAEDVEQAAAFLAEAETVLQNALTGWQTSKHSEQEQAHTRYTLGKVYRAQWCLQQALAYQKSLLAFVTDELEPGEAQDNLLAMVRKEIAELEAELRQGGEVDAAAAR